MPDWQELVRQRLSGLALDAAEKEEVHAELAAHLEESYESFCREGLPEQVAVQRTLSQVENWFDLQREIHSARTRKDTMTNRVTQLWLPGLLTFALTMILLEVVQKFGPKPLILSLGKGTPILMFYISWLLTLPLAGAVGAYLAKRAGGSLRIVLASSIFPVLPLAVVFLLAIPVGLAMGHALVPTAYLTLGFGWVLLPGVALLAGGFLVQFLISPRLTTGRVAGN
jgi:hypothetical protein